MRKLLISLLLASAAVSPALADPNDHDDRRAAKAERSQAREEARSEPRGDRGRNEQRPQVAGQPRNDRSNGNGGQPQQFAGRPNLQPNGRPDVQAC